MGVRVEMYRILVVGLKPMMEVAARGHGRVPPLRPILAVSGWNGQRSYSNRSANTPEVQKRGGIHKVAKDEAIA